MQVSLKEIALSLEMQGEDGLGFLDRETGEVEFVSKELLGQVEDDVVPAPYPR